MVKRPLVIASIGYILGIFLGLYFEESIALFFIILLLLSTLKMHFKHCRGEQCSPGTPKNILDKRYIKVLFPKKAIIIFVIACIIGNSYILFLNRKYKKIYDIEKQITVKGVITSVEKKEYNNKYTIKVKKINGRKYNDINLLMYEKKNKQELSYGDYVEVTAKYERPDSARNYGGFSYSNYLKQNKIYGTIIPQTEIKIIENDKCNCISKLGNEVRNLIIQKSKQNLKGENSGVFLGIFLGEKGEISRDISTYFQESNMAHILAVSGAHISYVILTVTLILSKTGKKLTGIATVVILAFFMILTNFTPSVVRASIMAIIAIVAKLIYMRSDVYNNLAIASLIILIVNPFDILNTGFWLSFLGTLGIVVFSKNIKSSETNHNILKKYKIKNFLLSAIKISIYVQILIVPIVILNFNVFSFNFLISGVVATPIFAGIMILGIVALLTGNIGVYLFPVIEFLIEILILISKVISNIPFSQFILKTPNIIWISSYYIFITLAIFLRSKTFLRILKDKRKINVIVKKIITILLIICTVTQIIQDFNFGDLRIHFIDVGQGDSCLIITPHNKTILIDGGGSVNSDYDVGKNVLVPYLLDRRIKTIDYLIVSHFDSDHCDGLLYVLEVLKVKNILVSYQVNKSNEYKNFIQIANKKKIKVTIVKLRRCNKNRRKFKNIYIISE